jgi:hypothetical protein
MTFTLLDMLLALSFGMAIGWTAGDEMRRRKNAEHQLNLLRENLQQPHIEALPVLSMLKQQRGILNDIHKRILAVSKDLGKQTR